MKRAVVLAFILAFGIASATDADTINLSLHPTDWYRYPIVVGGTNYNSGPATIEQTGSGHLRGTKTTATGGSNWVVGLETLDSFNFQNATLDYQWLVNGQGTYSGIYSGVHGLVYSVDPNPPYFGGLTTAWSFMGSEVIPSNQWLYTRFVFSDTGYQFFLSKTGYGNTDFLSGAWSYGPTTWAGLADARVFFQFGDNYGANAYFEVAEATIRTPGEPVPAVPEPASLLLLGTGLLGLASKWRTKV